MAETTYNPKVETYLKSVGNALCWNEADRAQALDLARRAAVPSRLEEDWRKTDPDLFPWDRVENVDPAQTRTVTNLRALDGGSIAGITPLANEGTDADRFRTMLMIAGDDYDAKFLYYHKALAQNPVCARIPQGYKAAPLEIVQRAEGPGMAGFTSVLLIEPRAEVVVYDRWETGGGEPAIGRTEIYVGEAARLTYLQEDVSGDRTAFYRRARIHIGRDGSVKWCAITPGALWHAARLEIDLASAGSYGELKGLFAGTGERRADHRTHQYHAAPNAKSDLTFKTLLAGRAHSVYQGLITVPHQAQKTDAYQQCRNLLLEPGTHADAIPKLEIIADDVRCTHGASMGSVNKEQVFYLMSRGLTRPQAVTAIATGFAEEIIRFVPVESVQERWRSVVRDTVGSALREE